MPMSNSTVRCCAILLLAACGSPPVAGAAEPPQWKFEPGLANRYRITQQTEIDRTGAGGDAKANMTVTIDMSWKVQEVKPDGSAVLEQRIDRMRQKFSTGDGQQAEIDSQSLDNPEGPAAMLVPLLKAITASSFTVTMTPRGEITSVEVPEAFVEALKNQPGAAQLGELAGEEGFKSLVAKAAFVIPETLSEGDQFVRTTETNVAAIGKQIAEVSYTYQGSREVDGKIMEVFQPKIAVRFEGGPVAIDVADQHSDGELLFNRTDGRMESSRLEQRMNLKIVVGGQETFQKIAQTLSMEWLPPDAE